MKSDRKPLQSPISPPSPSPQTNPIRSSNAPYRIDKLDSNIETVFHGEGLAGLLIKNPQFIAYGSHE